jgi:uncharacterized Zn finger protein
VTGKIDGVAGQDEQAKSPRRRRRPSVPSSSAAREAGHPSGVGAAADESQQDETHRDGAPGEHHENREVKESGRPPGVGIRDVKSKSGHPPGVGHRRRSSASGQGIAGEQQTAGHPPGVGERRDTSLGSANAAGDEQRTQDARAAASSTKVTDIGPAGQAPPVARHRSRRRRRRSSSRPADTTTPNVGGEQPRTVAPKVSQQPTATPRDTHRPGHPPGVGRRSGQGTSKRKPGTPRVGRGRAPLRLPSKSRTGAEFGTHWWARRWLAALEKFGWAARLERGRDYARRGNVLDLDITPGHIKAQVQGSRPWPYQVEVGLEPLTDEQWDRVIHRLGRQALYAAKLLAGDMPQNIEDIFNAAGVALIPKTATAFTMTCTCPDPVVPCKHIAAVFYVLGQEFDRDPFVLFELRGRTRQDVVKALQGRPSDEVVNALPLVPPMNGSNGESMETFWKTPASLADFLIQIAPAPVPGGLLKRLGPLPLRGQSDDWRTQLFDVYRLVSRRAYALGRGDERPAPDAPNP